VPGVHHKLLITMYILNFPAICQTDKIAPKPASRGPAQGGCPQTYPQ